MTPEEWTLWIASQSPVPPRGDVWGQVCFVGEAPGQNERLYQKPFVGEAGRLLSRLFQKVGIPEHSVWLDNICPFQPKNNDDESIPEEFLAVYVGELRERLASLPNLNLIVPLGSLSLRLLTGKQGISKWRGSVVWIELGGRKVKVLPTFHPAYLLRSPGQTGQVLSDLDKIKLEMLSPDIVHPPPKRTFLIFPKAKEVTDFLAECKASPMVSLDIETNPKTKQILCISLAPSATLSMCIPWERKGDIDSLRTFLASPQPKIGHNAALYDNFWLSWFGCPVNNLTLDTMYMHHCLNPSEEHSLAAIASLFTSEPYWKDEAIDSKEGTSVRVLQPSEGTWLYCCKDSAVTYEVAEVLLEKLKTSGKYDFYLKHYASLFPALLSMMLGGVRVDRDATESRFAELTESLKTIEAKLETFAGEPLVANVALSRQKEAKFLYDTLALPKKWTKGENKTGKKTLSTSEDTIRKLMERFPKKLASIGPLLLEHARKQKLSTFYNLKRMQQEEDVETDKEKTFRFFYTLKPSTGTGRLASSKSPFKTGCLLPTAEVLTRRGWVAFPTLKKGEEVMQWDSQTKALTFCVPKILRFPFIGEMVQTNSWFHRSTYTFDHRIPYTHYGPHGGTFQVKAASEVRNLQQVKIPVGGNWQGGKEDFPLIQLLVAAQADGSIEGGMIRWSFKKERKQERLLMLAQTQGIELREQSAKEGYRRFAMKTEDAKPIIELLGKEKIYGPWLLNFNAETLDKFLAEFKYWDGGAREESTVFDTVIPQNAAWAVTIAHLRGGQGSWNEYQNKRGYGISNARPLSRVNLKPRGSIISEREHYFTVLYEGEVWCLEVPTSFFLMRERDRIVVTGNSNAQNLDREARSVYLPEPGHVLLELDGSQVESRICYVRTEDPELIRLANTKPWEYDAHKENAARIFEKPLATITKEERYTAKISVHSAQRAGTGRTLQGTFLKEQGIFKSVAECQGYIDSYFKAFPAIKEYFRNIQSQLFRERRLVNLWGREITFPWDRFSDEMFREAYSFPMQSECAEWINLQGVVPLHNWLVGKKSRLLLTVHDSLLISLHPDEAWEVLSFIVPSLETPIPYPVGPLTIPVEISLGKNWATKP